MVNLTYLFPVQGVVVPNILPTIGDIFCPERVGAIGFHSRNDALEVIESLLHVTPPVHEGADVLNECSEVFANLL